MRVREGTVATSEDLALCSVGGALGSLELSSESQRVPLATALKTVEPALWRLLSAALLADVCEHGPASGPLHRCPAPGSSLHTPPRPLLLLPLRGCIPGPGKPLIPACFFAA